MKQKLIDITPPRYACEVGLSCPAVFKSTGATYVIIGKIVDTNDAPLQGRIGPDEMAIEISSGLLEEALNFKPRT